MLDRRRIRFWIVVVIALMVCLHVNLGYFSARSPLWRPSHPEPAASRNPDIAGYRAISPETWEQRAMERVVLETRPRRNRLQIDDARLPDPPRGGIMLPNHTVIPLASGYSFDPERGRDVIVFLHIQKTGGTTFGWHLVSNLELRTPCRCLPGKKKCHCRNSEDNIWTVNRYTTGWRCGLHADWTELTQCVDKMLDKAEGNHRDRSIHPPYRRATVPRQDKTVVLRSMSRDAVRLYSKRPPMETKGRSIGRKRPLYLGDYVREGFEDFDRMGRCVQRSPFTFVLR
ncbi:hypothetical protein LSH36_1287g00017 [Paralvinella palmiformis]|uniref:Heparan-sulfate 6-O-sulfotransferase n=1 Tax=Paralvinella palmiformis TaxID=53620 RepID=A0AAD9MQR1_9ANNE|nr:hypothetical protein LSH36_1287g00017 [Paralvinella palmiformis]